jgi:dihydrofolate reductase
MRNVTYGAACSLDGFIARPDGGVDWLLFTDDAKAVMADYWPRIDTILMGRKTWEVAAQAGGGGGGDGGMHTYVFSRTLASLPGRSRGATLVRDDAAEFVRKLKQTPGKEICLMGGGDFARSLLAAGVVDEIGLNVHPVLLGAGVPFLPAVGQQVDLDLAECRQMAGGCVLLRYRARPKAKKPPPKRRR